MAAGAGPLADLGARAARLRTLGRDLRQGVLLEKALVKSEDDGIWTREHDAILLEFSLTRDDLEAVGDRFRAAKADIERFFKAAA